MTPDTQTPRDSYRLLERILQKVESIDDNVDRILDQLEGHLDDVAHRRDWAEEGYDLSANHDDYLSDE